MNTFAINDRFICPKSFRVLLNIARATFIPPPYRKVDEKWHLLLILNLSKHKNT